MLKLYLSAHYLVKRRIALFGVAAVALCVALLIVITSLFSGFIASFHAYWEQRYGQVLLMPPRSIYDHESLVERLRGLECVARAAVVTETGGLLYLGRGDVRGVQLVGVEPSTLGEDDAFRRGLLMQGDSKAAPSFELSPADRARAQEWLARSGGEPAVGAIVGIGILGKPDELTDEYDKEKIKSELRTRRRGVVITTGRAPGNEEEGVGRKVQKACWIADVVQTGAHDSDTYNVYLPFDYLRGLIGVRGADGKIRCEARLQMHGEAGADVATIIEQVRGVWRDFAREQLGWSEEWIERAIIYESAELRNVKLLTREIRKQLAIMQVIMGLICVVAALLVFVILLMMVRQKQRDIGIIRAVGAGRSGVAGVFLLYGAVIGGVGTVLGLGLGVWATRNISLIEQVIVKVLGFKIWKSGVYMFSEIPNDVYWSAVWWIMAMGVGAAALGALLPAVRASRLQPVESLRYE